MKDSEKRKIEELFEYRKLPFLLSYLPKKESKKLYKKLIRLQYEIYCLDGYLEENWKLKEKKLNKYWKGIYSSLSDIGLGKEESYKLCSHIRRYQKHESQLRDSIMPTILNQEFYYHYKSCDVRLMRTIIYSRLPAISADVDLEDWRYFDLITEINDDVEDVFEDQLTINGNMFLISVIESGLDNSKTIFQNFITDVVNKDNEATMNVGKRRSKRKKMNVWTKLEAEKTMKLLNINSKLLLKNGISKKMPLIKKKALILHE